MLMLIVAVYGRFTNMERRMKDEIAEIGMNRHWRMLGGVRFKHGAHEPWRRHEAGQVVDPARPLLIDANDPATLGCLQQLANDAVAPYRVIVLPAGSGWAATITKPCSSCDEWHPASWVTGGQWSQTLGAPVIHPSPGVALCAALWALDHDEEPDA